MLGHAGGHVRPTAGEGAQDGRVDARDLGPAAVAPDPGQAQAGAEPAPELGAVKGCRGLGVGEEAGRLQSRPSPLAPLHQVGDQHVGVQVGVPGPAGVVGVGGGQEPVHGHQPALFACSAAGPGRADLEVAQRPLHRVDLGLVDNRAHLVAG